MKQEVIFCLLVSHTHNTDGIRKVVPHTIKGNVNGVAFLDPSFGPIKTYIHALT